MKDSWNYRYKRYGFNSVVSSIFNNSRIKSTLELFGEIKWLNVFERCRDFTRASSELGVLSCQ